MKYLIRPQCYRFVTVLILLYVSGCSDTASKTTISYNVTALTTDESGKVKEGRKQRSEVGFSDNLHESAMEIIVDESEKVGITIMPATGKTAQVTLSHDEQSKELLMTEGQMKNVFFDDSDVGVRIHVEEIKQ